MLVLWRMFVVTIPVFQQVPVSVRPAFRLPAVLVRLAPYLPSPGASAQYSHPPSVPLPRSRGSLCYNSGTQSFHRSATPSPITVHLPPNDRRCRSRGGRYLDEKWGSAFDIAVVCEDSHAVMRSPRYGSLPLLTHRRSAAGLKCSIRSGIAQAGLLPSESDASGGAA